MSKEYVFNYKVKTLPFWYTFRVYAESQDEAISAFLRENPFGIEIYRIVKVYDI